MIDLTWETVRRGFNTAFHNPSPFPIFADVALSNGCLGNEWETGAGSFGGLRLRVCEEKQVSKFVLRWLVQQLPQNARS